jgi:hypothetical protein
VVGEEYRFELTDYYKQKFYLGIKSKEKDQGGKGPPKLLLIGGA